MSDKAPVPLKAMLSGMKHGEEKTISNGGGKSVKVHYESEQALGDNNRPAKGYTVGYYHTVPDEGTGAPKSFRHSPHGPGLTSAKPYAAGLAADRIASLFSDRRP